MNEHASDSPTAPAEPGREPVHGDRSPAAARAGTEPRDEPRPASRDDANATQGAGGGFIERVLLRLGLRQRDDARADLEDLLATGVDNPSFSPQERAMLRNVLRFHRTRVYDLMVPRADIVAVAQNTPLGEMLRIFRTAGHSRLPVYGETLDDPKGMVHIRDFLDYFVARAESGGSRRRRAKALDALSLGNIDLSLKLSDARILRPVLFVPPSMPAVDLLVRMQTTRTHMALVIDEYGGTDGLVSIEDLVETVVGDIEDEHDLESEAMVSASGPDSFVADARADLEEVSAVVGYDFMGIELAEDVDTLGGLVVALAGRVPARSELIAGPDGFEFEVLDADPRRLKRVRIHRRDPSLALLPPEIVTPPVPVRERRPTGNGAAGEPAVAAVEPPSPPPAEVPAPAPEERSRVRDEPPGPTPAPPVQDASERPGP